jgi:hypothetical protein
MSATIGGELWPTFVPLWSELRSIAPELKLAGGYGLFLKQQWLASSASGDARPMIPLDRWRDGIPRVTKDIDLVAEVGLIGSTAVQEHMDVVLRRHGFEVVPANARWQFERKLEGDKSVLVDFHAPPPDQEGQGVKVASRRVKPHPALGMGIHGRENPMAVCSNLHPFTFSLEGVEIVLPNPMTLVLMKLAAVKDQFVLAQDAAKEPAEREVASRQARKHATDLFRTTAMMTREEYDRIPAVLNVASKSDAFARGRVIFAELFGEEASWGNGVVSPAWQAGDREEIQRMVAGWFR